MFKQEINYGVALISGKGYYFYLITKTGDHTNIKILDSDDQILQKGHNKGGQSSVRFQRLKEGSDLQYVKKVAEKMVKSYMRKNNTESLIDKLIVGGCGDIKNDVMDQDLYKQYFTKITERVLTTPEITDGTIHDVISRCNDILATANDKETASIMTEIKTLITTNCDKLLFGFDEAMNGLECHQLQKLIIDTNMDCARKIQIMNAVDKCQIIETTKDKLNGYGDVIGIKWY